MTTTMNPLAQLPPRLRARLAGLIWLIVFVAGSLALYLRGGAGFRLANIVAPLFYAVATLFIYDLLKPVSKNLSLLAAVFSLTGCAVSLFDLTRFIGLRDLVFFGVHCLLVGCLILRSTFLPRTLGVLMVFAGLGWLTFLWRALATALAPYNFLPGMVGEGALIVWLVTYGVDERRWKDQARVAGYS